MKQLTCEMCGSTDLIKQDGVFICQNCGCKYSVEEAKRMMIEGPVDVSGSTVKIDNSAFIEKYLQNARRAKQKEDWEETEKYYNMVEQNAPRNIEAIFYSSYAKARNTLQANDINKRIVAFNVLGNSISIIDDYFDTNNCAEQIALIKQMSDDLLAMFNPLKITKAVLGTGRNGDDLEGISLPRTKPLFKTVCDKFIESLEHIIRDVPETATELTPCLEAHKAKAPKLNTSGCYVATAVYGSYDCPQVWTLRRFRDYTLAETWYGRTFIHTYYAISPTLVEWFGQTNWFKKMWKVVLDRMVANLNADGVEDTPYEDRDW